MANVWLVRRVGQRWRAVDSAPAYQMPLGRLVFRLDLGWQRRLGPECTPVVPGGPQAAGKTPTRVLVEVTPADLDGVFLPGFQPGWYDSPYPPPDAAQRLDAAPR